MSEPSKAVFLSYASQDAEAVRRIAEALRASGVEVWFDQNELVGGEAWDAKIRGQIASCALFVPVISANTQERREGYFRIEWRLAAQRTHAMSDDTPFLLPVVIDATRDAEAKVPAEFKTVHWTKLPGGETPAKFCARVKTLLGGETDQSGSAVGAGLVRAQADGRGPAAPLQKPSRSWLVPALVVVGLLVAVTGFLALGPRHGPEEIAKPVASAEAIVANIPAKSTPAPSGPTDPDLQRVTKLLRNISATADDYALAEEILKNVFAQRPTDPHATILAAEVSNGLYLRGFDRTEERYTRAGKLSERALQLAPDDPYALNARGLSLAFRNADLGRADSLLRRAISLKPDEPVFYRNLTFYVLTTTNAPESRAVAREAAQRFPSDALTFYNLALIERDADDLAAMEAALDRAIAISEMGSAILMKAWLAGFLHGNMAEFKRWLDRLPEMTRTGERAVYMRYAFAYAANQPAAGLAALRALPGSWLRDGWFFAGPKDLLIGDLRLLAGQAELARENYESALAETMRQKLANPSDPGVRSAEVWTLLRLGRAEEARRLCGLWAAELARPYRPSVGDNGLLFSPISALLQLGERSLAVKLLQEALAGHGSVRQTLRVQFRSDGRLSRWRDDPEIAELLAEPAKATVATLPSNEKSVAVLAFANLSDDKGNEYFSDGIADELLTVLQKIPGLRVAARTSAFSFKGKNATAQEVGEKLSMAHVVEGSVQKSGNRVKITATLSRAATNEAIWSASYGPLELTDVFATQSEIAQKIVAKLRGQLTGETATIPTVVAAAAQAEIRAQVQAATKGGTKNPEAHQLYLQGRYLATRSGSADVARGIDSYEQALRIDPNFAVAWAALARARLWQLSWEPVNPERAQQARTAATRALALDADRADAHSVLSQIMLRYSYEWRAAREGSARALMLAPTDAAILTDAAATEQALGSLERSVELARRALALDPVSVDARFYLALSYQFMDRLAEAEEETRRMIDLSSNGIFAHGMLSAILLMQGRAKEALAEAQLEPEKMYRLQSLAAAHFTLGQERESDTALEAMMRDFKEVGPYPIAWVYAVRKDRDKAFEWLERAYQRHDAGISWLRADNLFKPLHSDPRWPVFLRKIGLADDQLK
jgi:TolB-like protein/Flp pilus assembly protein TadD